MLKKTRFCIVCGHTIESDTCMNCGEIQKEWVFLGKLEKQNLKITLPCPFIADVKNWTRCDGKFTLHTLAFKQTVGVSGNNPYGYLVATRHELSARCPKCGNCANDYVLILNNNKTIANLARRA